jgi:hypothetical protein
VDAEILPEPPGDEREALLAALAEVDERLEPPPAYRSPWRLAGLPGDDEDEL